MSTPILTKQQQRHSLSAKKKSIKGLRNVLAQPQDGYWPVVDEEKWLILEELLKKLLPAIKRPSCLIPWSQLKHMKKEERAQAKKEALLKEGNVRNPEIENSIILGINAITRSLEKDNVCCILMDANIEPQLLVKHIIHMALNKKVPILLLSKLKTIVLNNIGFATAACALKNIVADTLDHYFHPLYTTVCDISKDMPFPKSRLQLFKDIETSEQDISCKEDEMTAENESLVNSSEAIKFTVSTDVYVYRSSCKERAFIPPSETASSTNEPITGNTKQDEFISLSHYKCDEYDASIKKNERYVDLHKKKYLKKQNSSYKGNTVSANVTYLPLKVKRLQGDTNRVKAAKLSKQKKK